MLNINKSHLVCNIFFSMHVNCDSESFFSNAKVFAPSTTWHWHAPHTHTPLFIWWFCVFFPSRSLSQIQILFICLRIFLFCHTNGKYLLWWSLPFLQQRSFYYKKKIEKTPLIIFKKKSNSRRDASLNTCLVYVNEAIFRIEKKTLIEMSRRNRQFYGKKGNILWQFVSKRQQIEVEKVSKI